VKRWECLAPSEVEQVYKPNSVLRFEIGVAIIHLVQAVASWIKRSTRRS